MKFEAIKSRSVSELVAQRLIDMIRKGQLVAGQQLPPERELAVLFDVGRPAVREAIRGLSLLGLVKIQQGEGNFISSLNVEDLIEPLSLLIDLHFDQINELFDARKIIEGGITRLACERLTEAEVERLRVNVEEARAALARNDHEAIRHLDIELHQTIINACGNVYLQRVAQSISLLSRKSRTITTVIPSILQSTFDDHEHIVQALAERNPAKASEAMYRHLDHVQKHYNDYQQAGATTPTHTNQQESV
ncbi:transcription regulator protein [Advenella kashmirensis WT001]|uniref:Transcription regulator protein n=1 Tax=Advenella kashmirensis (strain DSM 17095 / LMG 22695 / WT001) TaxID=1036672 RepID=I3UHG9_ADVKW|nr:FadR/GntR family transcriptional regulator [Advenella kashmirensis]AFK64457.1 transcription regulator protein [Advenella kashmirensis WT001]